MGLRFFLSLLQNVVTSSWTTKAKLLGCKIVSDIWLSVLLLLRVAAPACFGDIVLFVTKSQPAVHDR